MNIRDKLIGFALLITMALTAAMSMYFIRSGHDRTLRAFSNEADEITSILAETIVNDLYYMDAHALRLKLRSAQISPNIVYTYATDTVFHIVSDGSAANPRRTQKLRPDIGGPKHDLGQPYTWIDGDTFRVRTPVLLPDNSTVGFLFVGFSFDQANQALHEITVGGLKVAGICIMLGILMAYLLALRFGRRIYHVSEGAAAIGAGNLDTVISDTGSDELATLAGSVNRMADNLKRSTVSAEYVSGILDSMIDLIIVASPRGIIERANPSAQNRLGKQNSLIGKHISEFVIDAGIVSDILTKQYNSDDATGLIETELRTANGDRLAVNMSISFISAQPGRAGGIVLTAQDATELNETRRALEKQIEQRSAVERELRQAKKMEAIGQLTGGIAHDFNNILGTIMGHGELAQIEARKLVAPRIAEYLNEIQVAGDRGKDLISQLLTFCRGGSGEPSVVFLKDALYETIRLLRATLPSNIELRCKLDTPVRPVLIDPVQLEQIVMNLCINARDAIQESGQIDVRIESTHASSAVCASCHQAFSGAFIQLSVSDTGGGIDAGAINQIFDPFFTTKEVGKGTGMGLSTTHGLVHEHNGHILVDTDTANGTCFRILLPPSRQNPRTSKPADNSVARGARTHVSGHVLIVDDEPALGRFLIRFLESEGLTAEAVTDPREALKFIENEPARFDVIVTDMTMPHLSGLDLSRAVHKSVPHMPVILCTGYSKEDVESKSSEAGISKIISKPISTVELVAEIERLLTSKPAQGAGDQRH